VAQVQLNHGTVGGLAALQLLTTQDQAGAQPVEGMLAQTRSLLVVELGGVLAMPDCGQCRGLGGGLMEIAVAGHLGGEKFGRLAQRSEGLAGPPLEQQGFA